AGRVSRADGQQARCAARSRHEDCSVSAPAVSARIYPGGGRSRSAAKVQIRLHRPYSGLRSLAWVVCCTTACKGKALLAFGVRLLRSLKRRKTGLTGLWFSSRAIGNGLHTAPERRPKGRAL